MTVLSASTSTPEGVIEKGYSSSSSKSAELEILRISSEDVEYDITCYDEETIQLGFG